MKRTYISYVTYGCVGGGGARRGGDTTYAKCTTGRVGACRGHAFVFKPSRGGVCARKQTPMVSKSLYFPDV